MKLYTAHWRPARPAEDPDIVLVPQRFSWWAALLPPVWLVWHRQWLGLLAWLAGALALALAGAALGLGEAAETLLTVAYQALTGALAQDWRRWRLARAGYRLAAVVAAPDREAAEHRFLDRWLPARAHA